MSQDMEDDAPDDLVLDRVRLPGRLLTGVGFANVIAGLMLLQFGIQTWRKTPVEFRANQREAMRRAADWGLPFNDVFAEELGNQQEFYARFYIVWAVLTLAGAFFATYGGYNLRTLNSYRIAMIGAVLSVLPPTSPASCLGIGAAIGIWAIVVLLKRDIRSAFATTEIEIEP